MSAPVPGCPGCEALQARLREAEAAFAAQIAAFQAQVAELRTLVAKQQEQIADLTARLNQNSGNSSQPPSADPPSVRAQRPKPPPSGRKRGGQPGHKGTTRCSFPPELVDQSFDLVPACCAACGAGLPSAPGPQDPAPFVHHVADLPQKLKLTVHEWRLHARGCPRCGKRTWATLPPGVPRGNWGPGVQALASILSGYFRLSRRRVVEFYETLFGYAPCLGTLVALEAATVAALRPVVSQAERVVQQAPAVNVDETGWRKARDRPTLWVVVAGKLALFRIGRRDGAMFERLLPPEGDRVVTSDRYAVYGRVTVSRRQCCWAHLKRNFQALVDHGSPSGRAVGNWALAETRKLFHTCHEFQRGEITRFELQAKLQPVQAAFRSLLAMGSAASCPKTAGLCRSLKEAGEALWTFATREEVEPTNNAAERALRGAVLWRKSSFGHQSEAGREFVETMLTVGGSLRLQGRPVLPFVRAACEARLNGAERPSLLPSAEGQ